MAHLVGHDHQAAVAQGLDVLVLLAVLQAQDLEGSGAGRAGTPSGFGFIKGQVLDSCKEATHGPLPNHEEAAQRPARRAPEDPQSARNLSPPA